MSMFWTRLRDGGAGLDGAGPGEQGHAHARFEGVAFVIESVFAEFEAVVTHVEDEGGIAQAGVVELLEDAADVFVGGINGLGVGVIEVLE